MESYVNAVERLQKEWGTLPAKPRMNTAEIRGTHHQIAEELTEWEDAADFLEKHGDCQEARDMLVDVAVDLIYYQLQSIVRAGLSEEFDSRFWSVWHNNVNKMTDVQNAKESAKRLTEETQMSHSVREAGKKDYWLVIRNHDGKICKPNGYVEV